MFTFTLKSDILLYSNLLTRYVCMHAREMKNLENSTSTIIQNFLKVAHKLSLLSILSKTIVKVDELFPNA